MHLLPNHEDDLILAVLAIGLWPMRYVWLWIKEAYANANPKNFATDACGRKFNVPIQRSRMQTRDVVPEPGEAVLAPKTNPLKIGELTCSTAKPAPKRSDPV